MRRRVGGKEVFQGGRRQRTENVAEVDGGPDYGGLIAICRSWKGTPQPEAREDPLPPQGWIRSYDGFLYPVHAIYDPLSALTEFATIVSDYFPLR